jgi:hypothetical protein
MKENASKRSDEQKKETNLWEIFRRGRPRKDLLEITN